VPRSHCAPVTGASRHNDYCFLSLPKQCLSSNNSSSIVVVDAMCISYFYLATKT
jgi:hypothetical protein